MNKTMSRIAFCACFMTLLFQASAISSKNFHKRFLSGPGQTLTFTGERCHLCLSGAESAEIRIEGECGKDIEKHYDLSFEQSGGNLEIRVEAKQEKITRTILFGLIKVRDEAGLDLNPGQYLNLTVSVPDSTNLCITGRRGDVQVREIIGEVAVHNSRGEVVCERITGPLNVSNSRGETRLESIEGRFTVESSRGPVLVSHASPGGSISNSRGDIAVKSVTGALEACGTRGNITVSGLEGSIRAEGSRCNIAVELIRPPAQECEVNNTRGDITLSLPRESGAWIEAHASRGEVQTGLPLLVQGSVSSGNALEGKLGEGGPRLSLQTTRGNIRIAPLNGQISDVRE